MSGRKKFILFFVFVAFFVLFVYASNFVRYFALKNYDLYTFTSCNPDVHSCFVTDPDFTGFVFYVAPYAKVEIPASIAPACLDEHTCENFSCDGRGEGCVITYCSEDVLEEGEICTNANS